MAYSPLAQAGRLRSGLLNHPVVNEIAQAHNATAAQILLAWVIAHPGGGGDPESRQYRTREAKCGGA